jgi:hypothetical protein
MPVVAIIDGVKIMFFFDDHAPPHFHVEFAEYKAQIRLDTLDVLEGRLPAPKMEAVRKWASIRRAALFAAWRSAGARRNPGKIP